MSRVFLVEPDARLREWCRLHLGVAGHIVGAFEDGRRALDALRVEAPDLVMIAAELPGMSPYALAAAIRSAPRSARVPILFLVPARDTAAMSQALAIDPEGVLAKPFSRQALQEAVEARLGQPPPEPPATRPPDPTSPGSGRGAASGPLLEAKQASVLVISVRNFTGLARAQPAGTLDRFLAEYATRARQAVFDAGGWIVRADAASLVALFEGVTDEKHPHAARALDAALAAVLAARTAKRWGETTLPSRASIDLSVGCGVHTGEVIVARLTVGGLLVPHIAGPVADVAQRLEGRARGLRWSVACSEAAQQLAGARFEAGYRSSLLDSDRGESVAIVEIRGYAPGAARPGELGRMAEVRDAILANSLLANIAADAGLEAADRTLMVRLARPAAETLPALPGRRVETRLRGTGTAEACIAVHAATGRRELVKILRTGACPEPFVEGWLAEYRNLVDVQMRNVAMVYETGRTAEAAWVATEFAGEDTLEAALRRQLPIGATLACITQACNALDGLHLAGTAHGNLGLGDFHLRGDGSLLLTDFNVSAHVAATLDPPAEGAPPPAPPTPRADFRALGRILHALLTGDRTLLGEPFATAGDDALEQASRLPLSLSPIQASLDALLGVGGQPPVERARDILAALVALRELYRYDAQATFGPGAVERTLPTPGTLPFPR